jgi:hypothetical protein
MKNDVHGGIECEPYDSALENSNRVMRRNGGKERTKPFERWSF